MAMYSQHFNPPSTGWAPAGQTQQQPSQLVPIIEVTPQQPQPQVQAPPPVAQQVDTEKPPGLQAASAPAQPAQKTQQSGSKFSDVAKSFMPQMGGASQQPQAPVQDSSGITPVNNGQGGQQGAQGIVGIIGSFYGMGGGGGGMGGGGK